MSTIIENFHFLRPLWLLSLLPALWLFVLAWKTQNQASEWQTEIAPHLLPWLVDGQHAASSKLPWYLLLLLWFVAAVALAGPTWEKLPQPLKKDSSALVVLFDLSPSMNVRDVTPSRLVRARLKLIDLLDTREEGLTALVAYAGEAHVVTPLTDDVETIKNMVPNLAPNTMPVPGSNAEMALEIANTLLKDAGIAYGNVVFITDGIATAAFAELKKLQSAYGHKISVWGFGTKEGAPIQLTEGGFARSNNGEIVVAKLDDEQLSDAAVAMNGIYVPFTDTPADIETISNFGISPFNKQQREVEREFDQWIEFGPWLVLLCLPLVALSFRRGVILSCLLVVIINQAPPTNAQSVNAQQAGSEAQTQEKSAQEKPTASLWDKLWLTPNQRAQRALDAGDAERAAELFTTPGRKGAANFRANNFEQAAEFFKQAESQAETWFNQGTALSHAGKYDDALAAYDKALELQPEFPQALNNRKITEKLKELEQQEQQQQEQQNNQQDPQQDQNQNQQGQNQQNQNQQNNEQQNSNQQTSDQQESQQQDNKQQADASEDAQAEDQQRSAGEVDDEKAKQDFEKQLEQAQQQQQEKQQAEELQEQQQAGDQTEQQEQQQVQQQAQQAYIDPDQLAENEDQQKLEQLLRRVPDDPGRLLRNKFRYEAQQRRLEVDSSKWNTPENSEEERW